ncbi:MAG: efflux RND transporter periplasmic adaptor subunit [Gammaproteobacteria bacterium]
MKPNPANLKIILPALLLMVAGGAAWGIVAFKPQTIPEAPKETIPFAQIIRVEPQTIKLNVLSHGVVMPRQQIDLVAEVGGKIVQLHPAIAPGGFFAMNERLLTIDTLDYDYAIVSAEADVAEAKRALISEQAQVEQAQAEWAALGQGQASDLALRKPELAEAQAKLQSAQAKLDRGRCELLAPFSGRVLTANAGQGQYVQAGSVVARIFPSDVAEVRLPIGTDQLAFLDLPLGLKRSTGHWPNVTLWAELAGKRHSWQGRIVRSEATLDNNSGQLYLLAQVTDPYRSRGERPPLLGGLFVEAEIEGIARDGLFALPRNAVDTLQQAKIVDAEQRMQFRRLDLLRTEANRVVVEAGLENGDRVIISDMSIPVAGMTVAIAAQREPESAR